MTQHSASTTQVYPDHQRSKRWWFCYWLLILLCVGCFGLFLANRLYPLPSQLINVEESYRIYDRYQQPLRFYTTSDGYWRFKADSDAIAPEFIEMLVRFEDKRFWQHHGVDLLAVSRAIGQRLSSGRVLSGASTISMQLARLIEPKPRTVGNKIREMFRAWQIEWYLDKKTIMDLYLTYAPYGGNIQGVEAASLFYFGVPASDLTVSQSALLVSLPQNPERLRPDRYPNRAQQRRDLNLSRLTDQQVLDEEAFTLALAEPVPQGRLVTPQQAEHESAYLRRTASHYPDPVVRSTLSRELQGKIEVLAANLQKALPLGSTVSIAIAERRHMELMAYVGTGDFSATQFAGQSDMLRAVRSPGSTLKPAIYAMAISDGWLHPKTLIADNRRAYSDYVPENFDGEFGGQISISEALIYSRNSPAIKVLKRLGAKYFATTMGEQGIALLLPGRQKLEQATLPIAVGGVGITMQDLLELYGCLANQGLCQPLTDIHNTHLPMSKEQTRWISPESAWAISQILLQMPRAISPDRSIVRDHFRMPKVAYKTGTSYGYRDAWAVGYDENWVIAVWVGRPDGGFQPAIMGLDSAVPILFSSFDMASRSVLSDESFLSNDQIPMTPFSLDVSEHTSLEDLQRLFERDPPFGLQYFDHSLANAKSTIAPQIFYPHNDTHLLLGSNHSPQYRQSINIQFESQHYPVQVMLNNERIKILSELSHVRSGRREMPLFLPESGAYRLKIIDAEGQSAAVNFWVDKAEE